MKDNTDLIEAYLNNELLGEALLNFENELKTNANLAEELALHRQIRGFVKENEVENLKEQVKDWLSEEEEASLQPFPKERELTPNSINSSFSEFKIENNLNKKSNTFSLNLFSKIAAGLAIFGGLSWYLFTNKSTQNLESQYLSELTNQNPSQLQGADDRNLWAQAYREKNYKKVIDILQKKKDASPEESYYLGLAYSAANQNEKALTTFSTKAIQQSVYAEKAEWAKALVYLKLYKKAEAKTLLNKIKNSDSQYHDSAIRLIDL